MFVLKYFDNGLKYDSVFRLRKIDHALQEDGEQNVMKARILHK